ncbi:MAG TPA: formyltransferase family protein [Thermoanaerobaculia bacterium]|nr:formyltransferase family protein [Thermoanaerobaculia bacterium]
MRLGILTAGPSPLPPSGDLYETVCVVDAKIAPPPPRNLREREWHDEELAEFLRSLEVDYVFAAGYPYILTPPLLEAFRDRVIVVQNGDLIERDENGRRRWSGTHPVLDALVAGMNSTRTSLYFATEDVGEGPLFLVGPRHSVPAVVQDALKRGDFDSVSTYALLHNRWMRQSWPALIAQAIGILAAGSMKIVGNTVWVDGAPGPCRLGEAPDFCETEMDVLHRIPSSCPFIES